MKNQSKFLKNLLENRKQALKKVKNMENEERIEKKIDLLYKRHLERNDELNFRKHLSELIPLFDLSIEMEEIKIKGFVAEKLIEDEKKIRSELDKLKSDREAGNFLAKDKEKMAKMIYNQEEKYRALKKIAESYGGIKYSKETLQEELLMLDLKEKLGISLLEGDEDHRGDFWRKETLEEELKNAIDWIQEELKEYKKKFG